MKNFSLRRYSFIAALVLGTTGMTVQARPAPAALVYFMDLAVSPDRQHVVTVEGETSASGGAPTIRDLVIRPTAGTHRATVVALPCGRVSQCWPESAVWTPDAKHITFALRAPGSHRRSIYQVDVDGQHLTKLLSFDGALNSLRYNQRGQLAMLATEHANKEAGAVEAGAPVSGELGAASPEQRIAILDNRQLHWASPANLFVYEYDWIPDGSGFVGTAAQGDGDNNWWIAKLFTFKNATAQILYTPTSPQQQLANPVVSRDGKTVAFIGGIMSDFGSTGGDIFTLPLAGGNSQNITPKLPASVTRIEWNCANTLEATVLAGDQNQIINFGSGSAPQSGKLIWSSKETFHLDQTRSGDSCTNPLTAMIHQSFTTAPEIAVGEPGHWRDLTHINSHLNTSYQVQSLNWKSDQFSVQGWLILPSLSADKKMPMITSVHGGPAAANEPHFIGVGIARSLLNAGYALFLPNPRGSYGQGEEFTASNVRDFGYGDLRDILAGVDAAIAAAPIDPERLGLTGHSYGGFMTMWAVTQTNRFKAAVAGAGISNWLSYYGENGIDEWMIPYFGKSVYDDPEVYAKSSAINFIKQVKTPTLSVVGAADLECPAPQTQEFGHALNALGIPSSTVIYAGEGHAFRDPANLADIEKRSLAWFANYLK